jgi:hypothetical protein
MDCSEFHEPIIEVLYGEADAETVRRVEQHISECDSCRGDINALRTVRRHMSAWKAPGFARRHLRRPYAAPVSWRYLAAAATLILAIGGAAGLSGVEVRYDNGPWALRLGRSDRASAVMYPEPAPLTSHVVEQPVLEQNFEALRTTLQADWLAGQTEREEALMRQLERMIRESEMRQASARQASISDLQRAMDTQRRYDLARITAGLSYLEGKSGANMARTTELMGYMLQASHRREP